MRGPRSWRERARPIIARVLAETAGQPEAFVRAALRDAYPFGERAMYPYKVWCDEVKRQRRAAPILSARAVKQKAAAEREGPSLALPLEEP